MVLEDEEIERLMARKKAIQATLAAEAQNPSQKQGGCSSGGCGSAGKMAAPRQALPPTGQAGNSNGSNKTAVLVLSLMRVAGLAAAVGVALWALAQAL